MIGSLAQIALDAAAPAALSWIMAWAVMAAVAALCLVNLGESE